MRSLSLRPYVATDAASVLGLCLRLAANTQSSAAHRLREQGAQVVQIHQNANADIWVAEDCDTTALIGCIAVIGNSLDSLLVDPAVHRCGVGSALLLQACAECGSPLQVQVCSRDEAALKFYGKHGFHSVKTQSAPDNGAACVVLSQFQNSEQKPEKTQKEKMVDTATDGLFEGATHFLFSVLLGGD